MNFILKLHYQALLLSIIMIVALATDAKAQTPTQHYGAHIISGNHSYGHSEDKPFAMHSVMKFPQALYVAEYLCTNGLSLGDSILVAKDSLDANTWSPMLATFHGERYFTYAELLQWSLAQSDNNACDILFKACGSPHEVEKYINSLGLSNIHIRLTEKEMKQDPQRAIENSSTPSDMTRLLEWFYRHKSDNAYLTFVWRTMAECNTGLNRIAAAVPQNSIFIHKTGSGFPSPNGLQDRNDVGIIILPDNRHIAIAVFASNSKSEKEVADIARQCMSHLPSDATTE